MTISEYIEQLKKLRDEYGELVVYQGASNTTLGGVSLARSPELEELAVVKKGRNERHTLCIDGPEARSGVKIIYVGR